MAYSYAYGWETGRRPRIVHSSYQILRPPNNSMAMVRQSPASQTTSRPAWPAAPTSSTPPETDEPVSHVNTGLHGAIGEHRRSSRSSSVSSGGSSGNGGDGHEGNQHQTQNRFSITAPIQHHQANPESGLDQVNVGNRQSPDQKEAAESKSAIDTKQAQQNAEDEARSGQVPSSTGMPSATEQFRPPRTDSNNSSAFGFFMGAQNNLDDHAFSEAPRQGRPITGPNTATLPSDPEVDISQLLENTFSSRHFTTPLHQELSQLGTPGGMLDSPASNLSVQHGTADMDMGFYGMGRHPSPNGAFGSSFGDGQFQPVMNHTSNQFSPSCFGGNQGMNAIGSRGANFYPQQSGFNPNPGFYSPNRQGNEYFDAAGGFQPFGSQDFSMPPPPPPGHQPWLGRQNNPNISAEVLKKISCRFCNRIFRWPHTLECLHVYCFPCLLSKYNRLDNSINCDICKQKTLVPNGPCNMYLDYQVCRYMRGINVCPFSCTSCARDSEAVICCITCQAYLCSVCREQHKNMHQLQAHKLIPITKSAKIEDGDYLPHCEKHPSQALSKYCCVCEHQICVTCLPDHVHPEYPSKEGNTHDIKPIFDIVAERMNNWNEDSCIKKKDVTEMEKQVPAMLQALDTKKRSLRKQIDDYTEYCKTVVEQNRTISYDMLDRAVSMAENSVMDWSKSCGIVRRALDAVTDFNIRTTCDCVESESLICIHLMENAYKKVVGEFANAAQNGESLKVDIRFDPNYKDSHSVLNQNFTSISCIINDVEHKITLSTAGQRNDFARGRNFADFGMPGSDNSDCNYQRWSAAPDAMPISTWNNVGERDRKSGTFIPHLNRCRTKTSYINMFGEYGRGEYAFTEPSGQAYLNDGSYVICDTNNHRIVYYSAKHEYIRTIGQPPNLPPVAEEQDQRGGGPRGKGFARQDGYLYFPNRVAICPITQHIVATERPPSHDVQIFTVEGEFIRCFGGNILQHPRGVTVDEDGLIIVVECKVMKLVMFNQDGSFIVSHSLTKDLEFPNDVAAKERKIFISDNRGHCVQVFNYKAEFLYKIGNESITYFPIGVSINYLSQVVVTDNHNTFNITVFDMQGQVLHIFESVSKLAQCHNVAVHPSSLELMLTTKDCCVYFFNYDPSITHPLTPPTRGHLGSGSNIVRRPRGNGNGGSGGSFY